MLCVIQIAVNLRVLEGLSLNTKHLLNIHHVIENHLFFEVTMTMNCHQVVVDVPGLCLEHMERRISGLGVML